MDKRIVKCAIRFEKILRKLGEPKPAVGDSAGEVIRRGCQSLKSSFEKIAGNDILQLRIKILDLKEKITKSSGKDKIQLKKQLEPLEWTWSAIKIAFDSSTLKVECIFSVTGEVKKYNTSILDVKYVWLNNGNVDPYVKDWPSTIDTQSIIPKVQNLAQKAINSGYSGPPTENVPIDLFTDFTFKIKDES